MPPKYEFMAVNNATFLVEFFVLCRARALMRRNANFDPSSWDYRVVNIFFYSNIANTFLHAPLELMADARLYGTCGSGFPLYAVALIPQP